MKNIKFLVGMFLFLSAFSFTSCENEPIDPAIDLDNFDQNCAVPSAFQASDFIGGSSVNLSWVAGGDEAGWEIQYGSQGFTLGSGTSVISLQTNFTVSGLNSGNSYSFYLRAVCGANSNSQWIGPVVVQAVVNPNCANPTALTAVRNATTNTTINLAWSAGGTETTWEIQYGTAGFNIGTGTTVVSTTTTRQITGFSVTSGYDFYVRAKCTATEFSSWVGPINVAPVANSGSVAGTYKLTAFNTSVPTDLNNDGTASTNQLTETNCFNDMFLVLNANNTFVSDSKGTEIAIEVDGATGEVVETIGCFTDPDVTGTWSLNGNVLSLTYTDSDTGEQITDNFNVVGNTLVATINDGEVVGTETTTGAPVYLTSDITIIYTKQ